VPIRRNRLRAAFGAIVRDYRIKAGLTQEQLSFGAHVNRTYIGDLEHGLKSPTLDVIEALATALNVEPHTLVEAASRFSELSKRERAAMTRAGQRVRSPRKRI
jgi:transcriptional regulator with XRE-family HTH domain